MTNKLTAKANIHRCLIRIGSLILVAGLGFGLLARHDTVKADEIQPLIDAVTKQITENQAIVNQKQTEGDTLQNQLTIVQTDLNTARSNLDLTRLKIRQTKAQLAQSKVELKSQQALMGQNIATIYKNGNVSSIEILMSSDNLSEFVGRQEYYDTVRNKLDANLKAIKRLQDSLDNLTSQLKRSENEEKLAVSNIAKKEVALQELLTTTRGEEATYRNLVKEANLKLSTLRAQQAAGIAAQSAGRDFTLTSDYPWSTVEPFPSQGIDPWGFYYRQCTSYAAWRRAQLGKPIPAWGFLGPANAKDWPNWGRTFNMTVDDVPEVGAIGVYPVGEYGHVMIVEAIVNKGKTVLVSEFNADWGGRFSESLWPTSALVFIH